MTRTQGQYGEGTGNSSELLCLSCRSEEATSGDGRGGSEQHPTKLRLDGLLGELRVSIYAVCGTRDRLHGLLEAVPSVGPGLDLPQIGDGWRGQIGALPSGHGLLGELIRQSEPLRLPELLERPASYGFPANHPQMHFFLGVLIRVRNDPRMGEGEFQWSGLGPMVAVPSWAAGTGLRPPGPEER
nr:hypothetical protein [Streptomyces albiflavescens]